MNAWLVYSLLWIIGVSSFTSCKRRDSGKLSGLDDGIVNLLNLSEITDQKYLESLCRRDDVVLFVANGEKLGVMQLNPKAGQPFTPRYLKALERREHEKESWYFDRLKEEYAGLRSQLEREDPACAKLASATSGRLPGVTLIAILDGPEIGDSIIEVSRYGRKTADAPWSKLVPATPLRYSNRTDVLEVNQEKKPFELLMPRDLAPILSGFRSSKIIREDLLGEGLNLGIYSFGLEILKGHGLQVDSSASYTSLVDLLKYENKKWGTFPNSASLFDAQDESGPLSAQQSGYVYQVWSPEAACAAFYKEDTGKTGFAFNKCVLEHYKSIEAPFDPRSIDGCQADRLVGMTRAKRRDLQGDEKQGDEKQGNTKQGDEKQGDTKQGDVKQGIGDFLEDLTGIDYGVTQKQGGKGVALHTFEHDVAKLTAATSSPAAFKILGEGLLISKGLHVPENEQVKFLDLPLEMQRELVVFDSCQVKLEGVPWRKVRKQEEPWWKNRAVSAALFNPFPLSADAIKYGSLNLQQYLYLLDTLATESDSERRQNVLAYLQKSSGKLTDRYCNIYYAAYECWRTGDGPCDIRSSNMKDAEDLAISVNMTYAYKVFRDLEQLYAMGQYAPYNLVEHGFGATGLKKDNYVVDPYIELVWWNWRPIAQNYLYEGDVSRVKEVRQMKVVFYRELAKLIAFVHLGSDAPFDPVDFLFANIAHESFSAFFMHSFRYESLDGIERILFANRETKGPLIDQSYRDLRARGLMDISADEYKQRWQKRFQTLRGLMDVVAKQEKTLDVNEVNRKKSFLDAMDYIYKTIDE